MKKQTVASLGNDVEDLMERCQANRGEAVRMVLDHHGVTDEAERLQFIIAFKNRKRRYHPYFVARGRAELQPEETPFLKGLHPVA